jgi:deacetylase
MKSHIFLSPHADDICYSAYASLMSAPAETRKIITIFSRSCWTFRAIPREEDWEAITESRASEDHHFSEFSGSSLLRIDLPDTSLRKLDHGDEYLIRPYEDPIFPQVQQQLAITLKEVDVNAYLYVPLGISLHLDHLIVRDAIISLRPDLREIFFYEDLPYVESNTDEEIYNFAQSLNTALRPMTFDLTELWPEKKQGIEVIYYSQLEGHTIHRIESYATRLGGGNNRKAERIWSIAQKRR